MRGSDEVALLRARNSTLASLVGEAMALLERADAPRGEPARLWVNQRRELRERVQRVMTGRLPPPHSERCTGNCVGHPTNCSNHPHDCPCPKGVA